jgi:hypothetical protein
MLITYLGPREEIELPPHGKHLRGQSKDYPDAFGMELLATSKRQKFEVVRKVEKAESSHGSFRKKRGEKP